ncbi:regulator of Ty1 Transposition [Malassezia yamatoensis]|uniref:Regulator of Ty1 Transposition n=1 Tax=Malassezia yamatoensis TaxID=253288 RepID=A0AAJ5YUX6_9BASI|nr:regulator of Ty1 Transposition [Malassezia yamatoensis]
MAERALFDGVRYAFADTITRNQREETEKLLRENGAQSAEAFDDRVAFEANVTHFISSASHSSFLRWCQPLSDVQSSRTSTEPCAVTPQWVTRSVLLKSLQPEGLYSPDPSRLFSGVVISCASLSPHDQEVIGAAVESLGGAVKQTLCEEVTHLVAISRESAKVRALEQRPDIQVQVVAPHWINDSFRLNRKLPLNDYLFDLRAANSLPVCLCASWDRPEPSGSSPLSSSIDDAPAVLTGKRVLFARDIHGGALESHPELHSLRDRVEAAGGLCNETVVPDASYDRVYAAVRESDLVVARYRESEEFGAAILQNKPVGTLLWLVQILSKNRIIASRDRLLHFPYPREPVRGFSQLAVTITNYSGAARSYLKELIAKMGGNFTPHMTPSHDVCIALDLVGEKVKKAREWNIPVVNHIWLEQCFATWTKQNLAQEQFISFPGAAQLKAVVGHAGVPDSCLEPWLTPSKSKYCPPALQSPRQAPQAEAEQPSASTLQASNVADDAAAKHLGNDTASNPLDTPVDPDSLQAQNALVDETIYPEKTDYLHHSSSDANFNLDENSNPNRIFTGDPQRAEITLPITTQSPLGPTHNPDGASEATAVNQSPIHAHTPTLEADASDTAKASESILTEKPTTSAQSERRAEIMDQTTSHPCADPSTHPVVEKEYEAEPNGGGSATLLDLQADKQPSPLRESRLDASQETPSRQSDSKHTQGQRPFANPADAESTASAKPSAASPSDDQLAEAELGMAPRPKRKSDTYLNKTPGSGRKRKTEVCLATTSVELKPSTLAILESLQVRHVDDVAEATHLVAKGLTRTEKMLCAIALGTVQIVSVDWLKEVVRRKAFIDPASYTLQDHEKEAKWNMRLKDALAQSAQQPGALLKGKTFYLSRSVQPSQDVLQRVIQAAGGQAMPLSKATVRLLDQEHHHIIGAREDRKQLWSLREQIQIHGTHTQQLTVWTPELILIGVLRQAMHWDDAYRLAL